MASTMEYSRKILNSPTYTEPCLVQSAKYIISPDNWSVELLPRWEAVLTGV
jgi:C-22 sterol desaturase